MQEAVFFYFHLNTFSSEKLLARRSIVVHYVVQVLGTYGQRDHNHCQSYHCHNRVSFLF